MSEANVVRIHETFYVRVPAEEARRLGLRQGQRVDVRVRPVGAKAGDFLALRGKFRGQFRAEGDLCGP